MYALTLVAAQQNLTAQHFENIVTYLGIITDSDINNIQWLNPNIAADLHIKNSLTLQEIQALRAQLEADKVDIFCTPLKNRQKKLFMADMDSTIVTSETLDELAHEAGIKDKIAAITARAMRGELNFHAALHERIGLLAGLEEAALQRTLDQTNISAGAPAVLKILTENKVMSVLVSGGFTYFTSHIATQLGFDAHHGNQLEMADGKLTGKVIPPILDKDAKLAYLKQYAAELSIDISDSVAIGDGANDLMMLEAAGLGIGYHPKPLLKEKLLNCILHTDLTSVLYMQGLSA